MKSKIRNISILLLICTAFIVATFDIMSGIFLSVFANTIINYILFTRQKSKTVTVKKKRPMTVDEFRQKEMDANPHRKYPPAYGHLHPHEFTD